MYEFAKYELMLLFPPVPPAMVTFLTLLTGFPLVVLDQLMIIFPVLSFLRKLILLCTLRTDTLPSGTGVYKDTDLSLRDCTSP